MKADCDFASFVLGYPNRSQTAEGYPSVNMRSRRVGAYFTDEWRVKSNLTITAGLRFDYMGNPYDLLGHVRTVSLERTYTTSTGAEIPTLYPPVSNPMRRRRSSGSRWRRSGSRVSASRIGHPTNG